MRNSAYKLTGYGNKAAKKMKKYFKVSSTGTVTVKKKLKKGTYKLKVRISAAQTVKADYTVKKATKTKTITIVIK